MHSYLVRDLVKGAAFEPGEHSSPWGDGYRKWLAEAGIELHHVEERVTSRPPSSQESAVLGIAPGVSVMAIERTVVDVRGKVVEVADMVLSGDRVAAVYVT